MFLNISTGGDLKRIVVRLCAWLLIAGLVGQTLIVGPIPRVVANAAQLPATVSAPPEPFEISGAQNALSLLPEMNSVIASLFGFAAPKPKENNATGFENPDASGLEPLYKESENGKRKTDNGKTVDSEDSLDRPDSTDSFDPNSEFPNPQSPAPPPAGDVELVREAELSRTMSASGTPNRRAAVSSVSALLSIKAFRLP